MSFKFRQAGAAGAVALLAGGPALAAHLDYYEAPLIELNDSGVSGIVYLTFDGLEDDDEASITVDVRARGLEPGPHAAHIHGFEDGRDSVAPVPPVFDPDNASTDPNFPNDGDGITELLEGAPFYGPILLTFEGLEANENGRVLYEETFAVDPDGPLFDTVFPLDLRETVLHGLTVPFPPEMADGEVVPGSVDTAAAMMETFNAFLPIATAEFVERDAPPPPVPLPAAGWMLLAGLGGLGALGRLRRRG